MTGEAACEAEEVCFSCLWFFSDMLQSAFLDRIELFWYRVEAECFI